MSETRRAAKGGKTADDRIEKVIPLEAPVARVWRAITDYREFGEWFRVKLDGPFRPGMVSTGSMTYPGFEGWPWRATIEKMETERLFAFRWHDFDKASGKPISEQPTTLVEFRLEPSGRGTRLTITESGFSSIALPRRLEVMRGNTEGWNIQAKNLAAHVASAR